MNVLDQKSETCTSESGCATSADKSLSEDQSSSVEKSSTSSNKGVSTISTSSESTKGPWTYSEHSTFLNGLYAHGKDWKLIAAYVHSRNAEEVQRHFDSYQKKEPFLSTLWRMLVDQSLVHIIAWLPDGQAFRIYNQLTFMRIPVLLYFGGFFLDFDHFQRALYTHGFEQNAYNGSWVVTISKSKMTSKKEIKKNTGAWSTTEHCLFLEGLEQHGRAWKDIVSFHVKTRTVEQVTKHGYHHLKKIDCYWTTKEHQLFLEGLEQHGRGRWAEISTHVGTKNHEQVSFHAEEYFEEKEMDLNLQKKVERNEKDSPAARKLVKKPIRNLINVSSKNAKRSRDQAVDSTSTSSKKRTKDSIQQKNNEQIVTPDKDTAVKGNMQNLMDSTNSLKPSLQKTTDPQHGLEATYDHHNHENKILSPCSPAKDNNDISPVAHKAKKKNASTADVHDTSCPICFEMFNDPHIVPECCHRFCKGCIEEALKYRRECPICRGRVTSRRALRRDEVFGKLLRLLEIERAKAYTNIASTLTNANADQLSDNTIAADYLQTKSNQEDCLKGNEETHWKTKDDENVKKAHDDAIKYQFQRQDFDDRELLVAMLEEKNTKIETLRKLVRTLSDQTKVGQMAAAVKDLQSQSQHKDDRIKFLESRQKTVEEKFAKQVLLSKDLENQLKKTFKK